MIRLQRRAVLAPIFLALLGAGTGCGPKVRVEGNVTLDGAPVDGGTISFFQGTGAGSDKGNSAIVGGKYQITGERAQHLTPGSYTVQIHWIQRLAKAGANPANVDTSPAVKELIPPKYNVKSELKSELTTGMNKVDFDLQSK